MLRRVGALVLGAALFCAEAGAWAPRIVNGVDTGDHPAVGALLSPANPAIASLVCSGTLIGCQTFLTAAHCVEGNPDPGDYTVFLQHAGFFAVSDIAVHPSYAFPVGDVAVLTLAAPVTGIRPMPIDAVGGQTPGTVGSIVGFGRSGGTNGDYGIKREGLVSLATCSSGVSDVSSICWQFTDPLGAPGDDSNTCNGDSGGPLFTGTGGGIVVAGVTSGGLAFDCLPADMSYDARVSLYASWIQGEGGADVGTTSCSPLPQVGSGGATVSAFAGTLGPSAPQAVHGFTVPADTTLVRVTMNGVDDGSDFDLYVKAGAPPTVFDYDCAVATGGQFGACEMADPAPGPWYVMLDRFGGQGPYQATASMFVPFCGIPGNEGLPCDDQDACTTGETCAAGACAGGSAVGCDDGIACTLDSCDPLSGCVHVPQHDACGPCATCDPGAGCVDGPRPDCRATTLPAASLLKLRETATGTGNLLVWKWTKGASTVLGDLGDPLTATSYRLCLYDESAGPPAMALRAEMPAGGLCGGTACWKTTAGSVKYRDPEGTPDGMLKLTLKAGAAGQAKVIAKGKGLGLPALPGLPLALPARVQLHGDGAACFEAHFGAAGVVRNDGGQFVGRAD